MKKCIYGFPVLIMFVLIFSSNLFSQTEIRPSGNGTSSDPYLIVSINNLAWLQDAAHDSSWGGYFKQTSNIDISVSAAWDSSRGFSPIGNSANNFTGVYDGNGYSISGLYISRDSSNYNGMFGYTLGALIKNLGLVNIDITGKDYTGGFVGFANNLTDIINCHSTGSINGGSYIGGLAGYLDGSTADSCYSITKVFGNGQAVGGFVGNNYGSIINCSYSSGSTNGGSYVGGLVGDNVLASSIISNAYSIDSVEGDGNHVGGLVGYNYQSSVNYSYSDGNVVNIAGKSGGLIGDTSSGSSINYCFWDITMSGLNSSSGGIGDSTPQMKTEMTFILAGWNFAKIWSISPTVNNGYPYLQGTGIVVQLPVKYPGFLGPYHNINSTVYGGWGWPANELFQRAFNFGLNIISNESGYLGYNFQANIDSSVTVWNDNEIYAMIRPPSESGVVNQPADTSLFYPFSSGGMPGMIQGAHRISELSKIYPQIRGIVIDDFFNDLIPDEISVSDVQEIKDALMGKTMLSTGLVDHNSQATTPNLKLFVVLYDEQFSGSDLPYFKSVAGLIDGVNFFCANQNKDYQNFDNYINNIKMVFPGKAIISGIYIYNSNFAGNPDGVQYILKRSIDLYDQGKINGVDLFSGAWLTESNITQARWDSLSIPPLLDSLYYPYLGEGTGKVVDAGGHPISHALVTAERILNGDTIIVAQKYTQSDGEYDFGAWAGKDSTIKYEVNVKGPSYAPATINITLQDQKEITLPNIILQNATGVLNDESAVPKKYSLAQNYPNPFNPSTIISYSLPKESMVKLKIYNILGQEVSTLVNKLQTAGNYQVTFNAGSMPSGVYFYKLSADSFNQVKKMLLLK